MQYKVIAYWNAVVGSRIRTTGTKENRDDKRWLRVSFSYGKKYYYKWWRGFQMLCGKEVFDLYEVRPSHEIQVFRIWI